MGRLAEVDKEDIAEIMGIILDRDYSDSVKNITHKSVRIAEECINYLRRCSSGMSGLFAGVECIPKSPNVYGWLVGCAFGIKGHLNRTRTKWHVNVVCLNFARAQYRSLFEMTIYL